MKKNFLDIIKHPLILGSTFLFVGSLAASILNYLFNLLLLRALIVDDYGVFSSLVSLFNIFSVFSIAIMMVFSKLTASLVGKNKEHLVGSLIIAGNKWIGIIAVLIGIILTLFLRQIASFLNIQDYVLIYIIIGAIFFSFLSNVPLGILQELLKFGYFSFVNISSSFVKLGLGIFFIFSGFKVIGAIGAFSLSVVSSYIFALIPLISKIRTKSLDDKFTIMSLHGKAYSYALPVILSNVGIISLISVDIILAKHYFNSVIAGQYAALSLMGRSIFYIVAPISSVLFPLIAQKKERKEKLIGTLLLSILLVGFPATILSIFYFLFPHIVLSVLSPGKAYLSLASELGPFSVFILFYSICYLLNSFYLSVGKIKAFYFTIGGTILECILIVAFHDNISQIVNDLIIASFVLLISLLLYYRNVSSDINS